MKAGLLGLLCVTVATLVAGCVIFPHGELKAPPARGKVVEAETLEPLPGAIVVRRIERLDRNRVTFADAQGEFAFKHDMDLGWLLLVDYAAQRIQYRIEVRGFRPFETNLYGGGSFYRGTLPHDLGLVQLRRESSRTESSCRQDDPVRALCGDRSGPKTLRGDSGGFPQ